MEVRQHKEEEKSIFYGFNKDNCGCKNNTQESLLNKEEEKSILCGCNSETQESLVERKEEKSILNGCKALQISIPVDSPKQLQSFLLESKTLGIVMPPQKPRFLGYSTGYLRMAA